MGFLDVIRRRGRPKTPQEADALALRELVGRGADLAQARHVIHFLYFSEETGARESAELARAAGWNSAVDEPGDAIAEWTVRVDGTRVVSATTIASFRAWFEHLADDHHGEYDGWEAAAKP